MRLATRTAPDDTARRVGAAALLGAATGMRSLTPVAVLVLRGRLTDRPAARVVATGLALGELVGDKLPKTPARTSPPPLVGRIVGGAVVGAVAGGPRGAAVGAASSLAASFAFERLRAAIVERTGTPDVAVALGEDALAVGTALAGATLIPEDRSLRARARRLSPL